MSYPNGVATAYTYDNLNRLTNLAATHTPSGTPITNFGYQYDAAGNRTQKSTLDYTEDYGYDPLYRLTRADRTNPGATPPNQWTWSYDAVGNRTSAQKDSEATTSTHNEKNQLLGTSGGGRMLWRGVLDEPGLATFSAASASINGQPARMLAGNVFEATLDLPAGANTVVIQAQDGSGNVASKSYSVNVTGGNATYTYDANGNLATKTEGADAWVYTWNALNQLTAVTKNSAVLAAFSYDPLGRRVEKHTIGTTSWTYDGKDILRQVVGPASSTQFVQGPAIDEPIAQEGPSGVMVYLHADALGSISRHTDTSGATSAAIQYDTWGNVQIGTPSPYGFTGREWDSTVSLWYYRARWYDSQAGRFLSEDPVTTAAGANMYSYVGGRVASAADPSGRVIRVTMSGPETDNTLVCPPGKAACTSAETSWYTRGCREKSKGNWGFDVNFTVRIKWHFISRKDTPSGDTPGHDLEFHENLHVRDAQEWYREQVMNSVFKTDGFACLADCLVAMKDFERKRDKDRDDFVNDTSRHDKHD